MAIQEIVPDKWIEQQNIFSAKAEMNAEALGKSTSDFGQASRYFDW